MNRTLISVSDFMLCGCFVVDIALPRLRRFWGSTFALSKGGFAGIGKEGLKLCEATGKEGRGGVPIFPLTRFPCFVTGPLRMAFSPSMRQWIGSGDTSVSATPTGGCASCSGGWVSSRRFPDLFLPRHPFKPSSIGKRGFEGSFEGARCSTSSEDILGGRDASRFAWEGSKGLGTEGGEGSPEGSDRV